MREYYNRYGLINARLADKISENTALISLSYVFLLSPYCSEYSLKVSLITTYIDKCRSGQCGLYHNFPWEMYQRGEIDHKTDYATSPDQVIAYLVGYWVAGRYWHCKSIYLWLIKHWWTYDNKEGRTNFRRIMQPMVIFLALSMWGSKYFRPIYKFILTMICLYSSLQARYEDSSSGAQKVFIVGNGMRMWKTMWVCGKIINFKKRLLQYYSEEGHPIRKQITRWD